MQVRLCVCVCESVIKWIIDIIYLISNSLSILTI